MWQPDITTLRLMLVVAGCVSLLGMLALWRGCRDVPGPECWSIAALLALVAYLLPPAVFWGRPDLGVVANASLTLSAMVAMVEGIVRFRGIGAAARRQSPLVVGVLGIVALMLVCAGRPWLRAVLHDVLAVLLLSAGALALCWRARGWTRRTGAVLAALFLALAGLFVWRGVGVLTAGMDLGGADTRTPPWLLAANLAWAMVWTVGFAVLVGLRAQEQLRERTDRDALTGLLGRAAFLRETAAVLATIKGGNRAGVVLLALGSLRQINETLGHAAGDRLLTAVAAALGDARPDARVMGRLNGGLFALLLPDLLDRPALAQALEDMRADLAVAMMIDAAVPPAFYSLGGALYPDDGRTVEILLDAADRAASRFKAAQTATA